MRNTITASMPLVALRLAQDLGQQPTGTGALRDSEQHARAAAHCGALDVLARDARPRARSRGALRCPPHRRRRSGSRRRAAPPRPVHQRSQRQPFLIRSSPESSDAVRRKGCASDRARTPSVRRSPSTRRLSFGAPCRSGRSTSQSVGLTKVDLTGRRSSARASSTCSPTAYHHALANSDSAESGAFDAVQVGIMDSEEFENRANIATKIADRLGLTGIPADAQRDRVLDRRRGACTRPTTRSRPATSRPCSCSAGERMKHGDDRGRDLDHVEDRRPGRSAASASRCPALIALDHAGVVPASASSRTRARASSVLARLMHRAHALGSKNPLAAFHEQARSRSESYFDTTRRTCRSRRR